MSPSSWIFKDMHELHVTSQVESRCNDRDKPETRFYLISRVALKHFGQLLVFTYTITSNVLRLIPLVTSCNELKNVSKMADSSLV